MSSVLLNKEDPIGSLAWDLDSMRECICFSLERLLGFGCFPHSQLVINIGPLSNGNQEVCLEIRVAAAVYIPLWKLSYFSPDSTSY